MYSKILLLLLVPALLSCSKSTVSTAISSIQANPLTPSQLEEIENFQTELNAFYSNPEESPLDPDKMEAFEKEGGHDFFEANPLFRIEADFKKKANAKYVGFETSTDRIAKYDFYGVAKFKLNGKKYSLNIYQSHRAREMEEYKDHLFLPFTDLTSGDTSYGGGRYVDLSIPNGNKILIDFNKAYNPYCAYSTKYSCPVPPRENRLDLEINAGVKYSSDTH